MSLIPRRRPSRLEILFFLVALLLAAVAIVMMAPIMDDYYISFRPVTQEFLAGQTRLYDKPGVEFYNAPWLVGILAPTAVYPLEIGQVLFTVLTLVSVLSSIMVLDEGFSVLIVAMAVLNQPFLNMIGSGEVDAFPLLGICIGYLAIKRKNNLLLSASFFLMATKPNNLALVLLLYLFASRRWQPLILPAAAYLVSALFIGWDWPLRLLTQLSTTPRR
jgi:hypothetical protein